MRMCKSHEEAKDCYLFKRMNDEPLSDSSTNPSTTFAFDAATGKPVVPVTIVPNSGAAQYLRPEVLAFAHLMEQQLRANDHKPGWKNDRPKPLVDRLREETEELIVAILDHGPEQIGKEAADVANFALMIADVCGCLGETK